VQQRAAALGVPVRYRSVVKTDEAQAEFAALDAMSPAVFVALWPILPQAVWMRPKSGCLKTSTRACCRAGAVLRRSIVRSNGRDERNGSCNQCK